MSVIKNCPKCGGEHWGSLKCPFTYKEIESMKAVRDEAMSTPVTIFHPVQTQNARTAIPNFVVLRAYEVYEHLFGPQPAMIDVEKGCRGGFSTDELMAFMYAHTFPKQEWTRRFESALERKS